MRSSLLLLYYYCVSQHYITVSLNIITVSLNPSLCSWLRPCSTEVVLSIQRRSYYSRETPEVELRNPTAGIGRNPVLLVPCRQGRTYFSRNSLEMLAGSLVVRGFRDRIHEENAHRLLRVLGS